MSNKAFKDKSTTAELLSSDKQLNKMLGIPGIDTSQRMVLEPRLLLDAAGVETADTVSDHIAIEQAENWQNPVIEDDITAIVRAISEADEAQANKTSARNEIIFIDSGVENFDALLQEVDASIEVVILDARTDGVEQIAAALEGRENLDAIHIISHGRSGTLELGSAKLTEASMNGHHSDEMEIIRDVLSVDADILIYGCDFGASARGESAVTALANATGADVAASEDLTGAASLGGDWDLEITSGEVDIVPISPTSWPELWT